MNKLPVNAARSRLALPAAALAALALVAAGCGGGGAAAAKSSHSTSTSAGSSGATTSTTATETGSHTTATSSPPGSRPGGAPAAFAPAASGTVASITGQSLEVQDPQSGQTTVDLTAKTRITATVSVALSDITPGKCITATGTKGAGGSLDATSIAVQAAVKGKCVGGLGAAGGFRTRFGGTGGTFPPGTGSVPRGSLPAGRFRFTSGSDFASGKVTAVAGSDITVQGFTFAPSARPTTSSATTTSTVPVTKTVTVVVSAKTRYTQTAAGTAASIKVGECATAFGSTNDIGVVTATRLTVSPATASGCTTGFGPGGGFGFGRGGASGAPGAGGSAGNAGAGNSGPSPAPAGNS